MSELLVRVPASAANLGPGFDTLGLALPLDLDDQTVTALGGTLPSGLRLRCRNAIPHGRGLGSSAAAAVGGAVAAAALLDRDIDTERETLLQVAAAMDGHADNAAASLMGGFVVVWKDQDDRYGVARLDPHAQLRPVAFVPEDRSATSVTRKLLPGQVPLVDAAFTASRSALGVCAFTARPELLFPATEDRLHQPYRRAAYPASADLMNRLRAAGIPAVVSGAGPTVLALTLDGSVPEPLIGPGFAVRPLDPDRRGAVVERSGS